MPRNQLDFSYFGSVSSRRRAAYPNTAGGLLLGVFLAFVLCAAVTAQDIRPPAPANPDKKSDTVILSDTLHYDEEIRGSVFSGNVVFSRGKLVLMADRLAIREDSQGREFGIATADRGYRVKLQDDRPATDERIEGEAAQAEYHRGKHETDLVGQASLIRYLCGKPVETVRGERIRYNDEKGTYQTVDPAPGASTEPAEPSRTNRVQSAISQPDCPSAQDARRHETP